MIEDIGRGIYPIEIAFAEMPRETVVATFQAADIFALEIVRDGATWYGKPAPSIRIYLRTGGELLFSCGLDSFGTVRQCQESIAWCRWQLRETFDFLSHRQSS